MLRRLARISEAVLLIALLLCVSACKPDPIRIQESQDILTQKMISPHKIPVTVLVKYDFTIHNFERAVEARFPQIDLIQVGNYTGNMGVEEYKARLKNDDLTDLVMNWPLNVGEEYWSSRLLDLSALSFTGKYTSSSLNHVTKDGKMYYLPGPMQVRGIVYNKTLFEENQWEIPTDFAGFIALCHEIEKTGIRALQLNFGDQEALDTAFVGYGYESCFSKPENVQMIMRYNRGEGSLADGFTPALNTFQALIDEGIFQKSDLDVFYPHREKMFFFRQCAMVEDSILLTRLGSNYQCTDEFALMPFFNPSADAPDWARLYSVCFIGVNKHIADPDSDKAKYDLIMELLDYISSEEGQTALIADTGAMFSNLKGAPLPKIPEIKKLIPALTAGRYGGFPILRNAQSALRKGLAGMISGTTTQADVVKLVDAENRLSPIVPPEPVIGSATANFSLIDTGSLIADVMRKETGCEIALFLDNGKDGNYNSMGVHAKFYEGDLTKTDVTRVLPEFRGKGHGYLHKISITGDYLLETLEHSLSINGVNANWFYYFSGLKMTFDPFALPGERIHEITDELGNPIDLNRRYSVAVIDGIIPTQFIKSLEPTTIHIKDALLREIENTQKIAPSYDGRFIVYDPSAEIEEIPEFDEKI